MSLSKDSEICKHCEHYPDCDSKRMEACAYLIPKNNIAKSVAQNYSVPIAAESLVKHDYRNIKIAENTTVTIDIEELKKKMEENFYKYLDCGFLQNG